MVNRASRLLSMVSIAGAIACSWMPGWTPPAHAAPDAAAAAATATAKAHYKTGTTYYDLGKFDEAIREFEAAYEAKSDPAFLFNLAQANRLGGHPAEALHFYRTYLRYVPNPPNLPDIEENIRTLEKVASEKPGTAPSEPPPIADSTPAAQPEKGVLLSPPPPPPPSLAPSAPKPPPNAPPVLEASTQPPPMVPDVAPGLPAAGGADTHSAPSSRRKVGTVLTYVGAGVFGTGILFGLLAGAQSRKVESAAMFDPAVESHGKTFDTLKWIGLVVGAVTAAAGVVLHVTSAPASPAEAAPRTALLPLLGAHFGGAALEVQLR